MGTETVKHVHTCPQCFEHCECADDCVIEHDLGLTSDGTPRGAHVDCSTCDIVWTLDKGIELCEHVENEISKIGFHVGLRGSVMLTGISTHDLDLIIYPHDSTVCRVEDLYTALCGLGLERQKTVAQVHEGWRAKGSNDKKNVEIRTIGDRVVDILYAGFDPYVAPLPTFTVWQRNNDVGDRDVIEAHNAVDAAEQWADQKAAEYFQHDDRAVVVRDENGVEVIVDVEGYVIHKFRGKVRT